MLKLFLMVINIIKIFWWFVFYGLMIIIYKFGNWKREIYFFIDWLIVGSMYDNMCILEYVLEGIVIVIEFLVICFR